MTKILHGTWRLSLLALLLIVSNETFAWRGMRMPELFVKGRYLMAKDVNGNENSIGLFGFDQYNCLYANGDRQIQSKETSVENTGKDTFSIGIIIWKHRR